MVHSHVLASAVIGEMRDQVCKRSNAKERNGMICGEDDEAMDADGLMVWRSAEKKGRFFYPSPRFLISVPRVN